MMIRLWFVLYFLFRLEHFPSVLCDSEIRNDNKDLMLSFSSIMRCNPISVFKTVEAYIDAHVVLHSKIAESNVSSHFLLKFIPNHQSNNIKDEENVERNSMDLYFIRNVMRLNHFLVLTHDTISVFAKMMDILEMQQLVQNKGGGQLQYAPFLPESKIDYRLHHNGWLTAEIKHFEYFSHRSDDGFPNEVSASLKSNYLTTFSILVIIPSSLSQLEFSVFLKHIKLLNSKLVVRFSPIPIRDHQNNQNNQNNQNYEFQNYEFSNSHFHDSHSPPPPLQDDNIHYGQALIVEIPYTEQITHETIIDIIQQDILTIAMKIASRYEVLWIEPYHTIYSSNKYARGLCQSGSADFTPFDENIPDLTGKGQIIGVADTGLDARSCYFSDTTADIVSIVYIIYYCVWTDMSY